MEEALRAMEEAKLEAERSYTLALGAAMQEAAEAELARAVSV